MSDKFLRKYGAGTTVVFDLYDPDDGQGEESATHAAGDTKISKDEGAEANTNSGFASEGGNVYSLALTATEMQAARIYIRIVDQTATKVWLDKVIVIETYGNASAQHAFDLDDGDGTTLTEAGGTGDQLTALATQTSVDTVDGNVDAILVDTNELQGDWTNGGRLDLIIDAIKAETDKLASARSEPTGVPAANEAPLTKLDYLFMALRNQLDVTATKKTFYDDGGAAEWEKDLSDDGSTYSESEGNAI